MFELSRSAWILLACLALALGATSLFLVDAGATEPEPVHFDDTVSIGLALGDELALEDDVEFPRVQVFYSQYQYVVGYYGVETFVNERHQAGHEQRFGYPRTVYVSDYSGVSLELTEEGYPKTERFGGWTDAETAFFVVDSEAEGPNGETVLPFSDRSDADRFVDEHGGTVVSWEDVLDRRFDVDDAETVRDRVEVLQQRADDLVSDSEWLLERPDSTVVGDDQSIQDAIDAAPENTTVVVPEGTYDEGTIEIDRSITLAGDGNVTVRGDENGSVISIGADDVAVSGLQVTGVGDELRDPDADIEEDTWDHNVQMGYGHGDAGIEAIDVTTVRIEDVEIETPANGVLLRDVPEPIVRNVTVDGTDDWRDGFMGVMAMRAPGVIEDSTFDGGRDGVYTHRSDTLVVRDNEMRDGRFGVHLMHTSDMLTADNHVRGQDLSGIIVMTSPERNAIVGNDVRESTNGIRTSGSHSYVAQNVLIDNELGFTTSASSSIYENNLVARNELGAQASTIVPTNRVVGNDFIENDVHAEARPGPLRLWTYGGAGNYWQGAVGASDGVIFDRSYSPTDPVDKRLHHVDGTPTLTQAPALDALEGLQGTAPGMRADSIVDTAPRCGPANPDLFVETPFDPATYDCNSPP